MKYPHVSSSTWHTSCRNTSSPPLAPFNHSTCLRSLLSTTKAAVSSLSHRHRRRRRPAAIRATQHGRQTVSIENPDHRSGARRRLGTNRLRSTALQDAARARLICERTSLKLRDRLPARSAVADRRSSTTLRLHINQLAWWISDWRIKRGCSSSACSYLSKSEIAAPDHRGLTGLGSWGLETETVANLFHYARDLLCYDPWRWRDKSN